MTLFGVGRAKRRSRCVARRLPAVALLAAICATTGARSAQALVSLRLEPVPSSVVVDGVLQTSIGESVEIDIVAAFDTAIVGWGLDLEGTQPSLQLDDVMVDSAWAAVFAPDGDGLAGLTPAPGVTGDDIVLATLTLTALLAGESLLHLAVTEADLTEGFALQGVGQFDAVDFGEPLRVVVTPEPATGVLVASSLVWLGVARRRGWVL